jgi:hypothetical protein
MIDVLRADGTVTGAIEDQSKGDWKMKTRFLLGLIAITLLASCSAVQLKPEAEHIRIVTEQPSGCVYLGEVVGSQGNLLVGHITSNENLERGALNDMKNKAYEMGANVLHMVSSRAGQTGQFQSSGIGSMSQGGGSLMQTNVTYVGVAYKCP